MEHAESTNVTKCYRTFHNEQFPRVACGLIEYSMHLFALSSTWKKRCIRFCRWIGSDAIIKPRIVYCNILLGLTQSREQYILKRIFDTLATTNLHMVPLTIKCPLLGRGCSCGLFCYSRKRVRAPFRPSFVFFVAVGAPAPIVFFSSRYVLRPCLLVKICRPDQFSRLSSFLVMDRR